MSLVNHRHKAVVAGLAATLTLGAVSVPLLAAPASAHADAADDPTSSSAAAPTASSVSSSDQPDSPSAAPTGNETLYEEEGKSLVETLASLFSARSASTKALAPKKLSDEMKYFTVNESGQNYDQGFSRGDGYNALGYYQFDRRHALVPFMQQVYAYNPTKYAMFKPVLDRASELKTGTIYGTSAKRLTSIGQLAQDAWHAAYAPDPSEFSALQDGYAYETYYVPAANGLLKSYGVDLSDRYDCVKGLVWGMTSLFGQGGVKNFFAWANVNDRMTDEELVSALCDAVVDHIKEYRPNQSKYWNGWINRYKREKQTCLSYIAQHRAAEKDDAGAGEGSGSQGGSGGTVTPDAGGSGGSGESSGENGGSGTGGGSDGSAGSGSDSGSAGSDEGSGSTGGDIGNGSAGSGSIDGSGDSAGGSNGFGSGSADGSTGADGVTGSGSGNGSNSGSSSETGGSGSVDSGESNGSGTSGDASSGAGSGTSGSGGSAGSGETGTTDGGSGSHDGVDERDGSSNSSNSNGSSTSGSDTSGSASSEDDGDGSNGDGDQGTTGDAPGSTDGSAKTSGGLPSTGDAATIVTMGAAGLATMGATLTAYGRARRKAAAPAAEAPGEQGGSEPSGTSES